MSREYTLEEFKDYWEEYFCELTNPLNSQHLKYRNITGITKHYLCSSCEKQTTLIKSNIKEISKYNLTLNINLSDSTITKIDGESKKKISENGLIKTISVLSKNGSEVFQYELKDFHSRIRIKYNRKTLLRASMPVIRHANIRKASPELRSFLNNIYTHGIVNIKDEAIWQNKKQLKTLKREIDGEIVCLDDVTVVAKSIFTIEKVAYTNDKAINPKYDFVSGLNAEVLLTSLIKDAVFLTDRAPDFYIDMGFLLSGRNAANYFHALIEDISSAYAVKDKIPADVPLLIDAELPKALYSLISVLFPNRPTIRTPKDSILLIRKLYVSPRELEHHDTIFKSWNLGANVNLENLRKISQDVNDKIPPLGNQPKRFVIKRDISFKKSQGRETYFSFIVTRYLKKNGFIFIDPAKLSFYEQVELFKNAEIIVSPSGAALTNLIFASPSTNVFVFIPSMLKNFEVWRRLGLVNDCKVDYVEVPAAYASKSRFTPYQMMHSPIYVGFKSLKRSGLINRVDEYSNTKLKLTRHKQLKSTMNRRVSQKVIQTLNSKYRSLFRSIYLLAKLRTMFLRKGNKD